MMRTKDNYTVGLRDFWRAGTGLSDIEIENMSPDGRMYDITLHVPIEHVDGVLRSIAEVAARDRSLMAAGIPTDVLAARGQVNHG